MIEVNNEIKVETKKDIRDVSVFLKINKKEFSMLKRVAKKMNVSRTELIVTLLKSKDMELKNANKK